MKQLHVQEVACKSKRFVHISVITAVNKIIIFEL